MGGTFGLWFGLSPVYIAYLVDLMNKIFKSEKFQTIVLNIYLKSIALVLIICTFGKYLLYIICKTSKNMFLLFLLLFKYLKVMLKKIIIRTKL